MPDEAILALAVREERLVITLDKDFGTLVFGRCLPHAGILLLRMDEAAGAEKASAVAGIVARHGGQLAGRFVVFKNQRLRF